MIISFYSRNWIVTRNILLFSYSCCGWFFWIIFSPFPPTPIFNHISVIWINKSWFFNKFQLAIQVFFFLFETNQHNSNTKIKSCFDVILPDVVDTFFTVRYHHPSLFEIIQRKKIFFFQALNCLLKCRQDIFFLL